MKCKAILFDLDGVLVDACDWHYEALNLALNEYNYPIIERQKHETLYNGLPTLVKLELLNIPKNIAIQINEAKQKYTLKTIKSFGYIMKEKIELHSYLKNNNIKIGCVTNSIKETTVEMLKITGQYDFMDLIITNEDVVKNKPHPDCYNLAINKLQIDPKYILCVEDSQKGIHAAVASIAKYLLVVKNSTGVNLTTIKNKLKEIDDENIDSYGG